MLTRACQPGWELVLLSLIILGEINILGEKMHHWGRWNCGVLWSQPESSKSSRAMFWGGWMTEYHKQQLWNDVLTKQLELARILGRDGRCLVPWGGPGQGMLAHLNYLLGLKPSLRTSPQPATACPTALCGASEGSAAAVCELRASGRWSGVKVSLTRLLNCFTMENLVLLDTPRRDAAIHLLQWKFLSNDFCLFLTTETCSHY